MRGRDAGGAEAPELPEGPDAPEVPPPPEDPEELAAWAEAHGVGGRLDDVLIGGHGPVGTTLPARRGEVLTYRQILMPPPVAAEGAGGRGPRRDHDVEETARRYLHRIATLASARRRARAWMDHHGGDPEDSDVLAAFLDRLRSALRDLAAATVPGAANPRRPDGTYEPREVRVARAPVPMLRYAERTLTGLRWDYGADGEEIALALLGWNEGPLRWQRYRGDQALEAEVPASQQYAALEAMIDLVRDPRRAADQAILDELLRLPAWQYALGRLQESLERIDAVAAAARGPGGAGGGPGPGVVVERVAFRVTVRDASVVAVQPVVQKRGRGGAFSKGAQLEWFQLPQRQDLTPADRRAYLAHDDRFARHGYSWGGGPLTAAQTFGVLRALIDHPAVLLDGPAEREGGRLDIRQGRLRLRFAVAPGGGLSPLCDLLGVALLPVDVARTLRDDRFLVHVHRPEAAAPQVLLAEISAQAAAVVNALALAPAQFPPEAHDALAARLETLQETVDIEFPSQWTRTIAPADGRLIARLDLLASGAVQVRLAVRPVALGPVFAPGEGPALVLEGQGRDRHGARRDRQAERQAGHALADRLGLGGGDEQEPWCWRVAEGDPALHLVATLREMGGDEVGVEWTGDGRLDALGSIGRRDISMKVADRRDWFSIEGGAAVAGQTVPLVELLAAIRDGRRYVAVGARGFARIEESLREALARAEPALFDSRGVLGLSAAAAVAGDPLMGLVEEEQQIEAGAAFAALRRRMKEGWRAGEEDGAALGLPAALDAALRPYQKAGVAWMARLGHWGAGAVLADEMGLGKTVQTLAALIHRAPQGPALVVAPTSVVSIWVGEAARFAPQLSVRLYRGADRAAGLRGLGPGDVVVTSYGIATLDAAALAAIRFGTLVLDEAQAVKNAATERAKALREIDAGWRLGLTGTPIENHLGELWSLMRVVSPGLLGSWEQFRARFAVPIEKFGDVARGRALAALLRPFVLRRVKAEVARELPPLTEVVRSVRLSPEERALYEQLRQALVADIAAAKKDPDRDARGLQFVLLSALTRLRQLCCHPRLVYPDARAGSSKAAQLLDLLGELRAGGHRTLVFSQFRSFLDLLAPRLRQHGFAALSLDGTTPPETREQRIAAFQRGEADVFLISLKAGGFGLNLTAADTVIHMDPWWNPAVEDQATARAHRIGQPRPVTAIRIVARGTIEESVLNLHATKRALAATVLEGTDAAAALGTDELVDLIRRGLDPDA